MGKFIKIKHSLKSVEVELAIKPCCLGETSNYVSQHEDARICPVLDNSLATLPRTPISRKEKTLK